MKKMLIGTYRLGSIKKGDKLDYNWLLQHLKGYVQIINHYGEAVEWFEVKKIIDSNINKLLVLRRL